MQGYTINCSASKNNTFINLGYSQRNKKYKKIISASIGHVIRKKNKNKKKKKIANKVVGQAINYVIKRLNRLKTKEVVVKFKSIQRGMRKPILQALRGEKIKIKLLMEQTTTPHNGCKRSK